MNSPDQETDAMITTLDLTAITDFTLAGWALFLGGRMFEKIQVYTSEYALLTYFVLAFGIAPLIGGIHHGFFDPHPQDQIWIRLTYYSVAISVFFLFWFTIEHFTKGKIQKILKPVAVIQLIAFVILTYNSRNFLHVIINCLPVMLFFLVMNLINLKKGKAYFKFCLFAGLVFLISLLQVAKVGINELWNHSTVNHILLMLPYYVIFLGAKDFKNQSIQV